jgi:hypothetical protein
VGDSVGVLDGTNDGSSVAGKKVVGHWLNSVGVSVGT